MTLFKLVMTSTLANEEAQHVYRKLRNGRRTNFGVFFFFSFFFQIKYEENYNRNIFLFIYRNNITRNQNDKRMVRKIKTGFTLTSH
jgi:hypothetical protein